jgi:hypothetical protein
MKVNVAKKQAELAQRGWAGLEEILTPRCSIEHWRRREIQKELGQQCAKYSRLCRPLD